MLSLVNSVPHASCFLPTPYLKPFLQVPGDAGSVLGSGEVPRALGSGEVPRVLAVLSRFLYVLELPAFGGYGRPFHRSRANRFRFRGTDDLELLESTVTPAISLEPGGLSQPMSHSIPKSRPGRVHFSSDSCP